jgi:hypothetical protein
MSSNMWIAALVTVVALGVASASLVTAQAPAPAPAAPAKDAKDAPMKDAPAKEAAKPKPVPQKRFASAEEAVEALVAALRANNTAAMLAVLGSDGRSLVSSGDAVADRRGRETFVKAYDEAHALVAKGEATTLTIGKDEWPFPIPVVKDGDRWRFDTKAGREEMLARRIGRNELYTMQVCLAYVDAQREYWAEQALRGGVAQYAQKFASTPGKRDGLYWETRPGQPPSPLGSLVVRARAEGYRRDAAGGPTPYHGYLFRILTSQGTNAVGGSYDYIVRGQMIAGFGLVAYPAQYGASGVMTFIVNHDGVVYEKDLGPDTPAVAAVMSSFDPDPSWTKADVAN